MMNTTRLSRDINNRSDRGDSDSDSDSNSVNNNDISVIIKTKIVK